MKYHGIEVPPTALKQFCERHRIRRLSFFGSVLRADFCAESDVDVLVAFEQGATPGLEFFDMQDELSQLLDRKVDMHTEASLSKYFRDQVVREAEVQYDAA